MNTRLITRLQELARTMPSFRQQCTRQLPGKELLAMGYTHWEGRPVDPHALYTVPITKETNQVRMLTRIYHAHGYRAVLQHVHRYATHH